MGTPARSRFCLCCFPALAGWVLAAICPRLAHRLSTVFGGICYANKWSAMMFGTAKAQIDKSLFRPSERRH